MSNNLPIAFRYTILPGDSFSKLAIHINACAGITLADILTVNPGLDPTQSLLGTEVLIPALETGKPIMKFTITADSSLQSLPEALNQCKGITYQQIESANTGVNPTSIRIGELINVPALQGIEQLAERAASAAATKPKTSTAEHIGYWCWTWSAGQAPDGATLGLAFSGWNNVATALSQSNRVLSKLAGTRFITIGGGNENGAFNTEVLSEVNEAINKDTFAAYDGIAFDVEEGTTGLAGAFQQAFQSAKEKGLQVLVTISHSAPFGIKDAAALMQSFFDDENIDLLSPQLYTTGKETENNYATSGGVTWLDYKNAKAAIVPSIVAADFYASAQEYFNKLGVNLQGFIQWSKIG